MLRGVIFDVIWPMVGMGGDKLLPSAAGVEADSTIGEQLSARRWGIFRSKFLPSLRPTNWSRELVESRRAIVGRLDDGRVVWSDRNLCRSS
ncbi:MAG: hypothetical protein ABIQ55_10555 [Gemmatimonadaceae bacterium]